MGEKDPDLNEVRLRGRVADQAHERVLPSGDTLVTVRLIVDRPQVDERRRVDTLDCVCWTRRAQRSASSWSAGDVVEVQGAVRRRFFGAAGARVSRVEIEVTSARRVARAPSVAASA